MGKKSNKPSWTSDLKKAYSAGYKAGYYASKEIPDRFGTRRSAMTGFSSAIKSEHQKQKHVKKNYEK